MPLGAIGLALVALAVAFAAVGVPRWIPAAPLAYAGLPSPLEGMTRSFVAMVSGHAGDAFVLHPLGPPAFAAAAAAPVLAAVSWARGRRVAALARALRSRALWLGVGAAFAAVWLARVLEG